VAVEPCMCGAWDCSVCGPLQGVSPCQTHHIFDCDKCACEGCGFYVEDCECDEGEDNE